MYSLCPTLPHTGLLGDKPGGERELTPKVLFNPSEPFTTVAPALGRITLCSDFILLLTYPAPSLSKPVLALCGFPKTRILKVRWNASSQWAPTPISEFTYLTQDFRRQMHEAQHIAFIPRIKHTEVVRDVIGTILTWGHAKVLG